jgi:hypothetical protein
MAGQVLQGPQRPLRSWLLPLLPPPLLLPPLPHLPPDPPSLPPLPVEAVPQVPLPLSPLL